MHSLAHGWSRRFRAAGLLAAALVVLAILPARAGVLEVVPVADNVYALVGPLGQRSADNLGNNATFGVVVTDAGVVLIDSGGSARGAAMIAETLQTITDKPVVTVINTGGQDHRWLGNAYFKSKGAEIIAADAAVRDQTARADEQFFMLTNLIGEEALAGTEAVPAERTFESALELEVGGTKLVLKMAGPAHTPGDTIVWLPKERIAFAGDVVFLDRMLGVLPYSNSAGWIAAFKALEVLDPAIVVPGHGRPAPLSAGIAQTFDVLVNLRSEVGAVLERGGDMTEAADIDQSAFAALPNFETLSRRNAQAVFMEMEFE
ncbi:glyoxylase-like metal-dependent hydrolase (beta-lactamase superfamily II) [Rhodobium orientis]|nr:MBL fold metallo-hydrolase [Rhodobium orientis]MBB4303000.1 glyoxylase-like metal-dependent hydrolase (beta-lactamase superfamily II) [Rhodobium orientis]